LITKPAHKMLNGTENGSILTSLYHDAEIQAFYKQCLLHNTAQTELFVHPYCTRQQITLSVNPYFTRQQNTLSVNTAQIRPSVNQYFIIQHKSPTLLNSAS